MFFSIPPVSSILACSPLRTWATSLFPLGELVRLCGGLCDRFVVSANTATAAIAFTGLCERIEVSIVIDRVCPLEEPDEPVLGLLSRGEGACRRCGGKSFPGFVVLGEGGAR